MYVSRAFEKKKFQKGVSGNPAGRPRGTPNKSSLCFEVAKICYAQQCNPFEVLCWIATNNQEKLGISKDVGIFERREAASDLAQYLAPRLKAIQHSGDSNNPFQVTINLGENAHTV